jgi:hypothetical protein
MSFSSQTFTASSSFSIPSFTGPVTSPRFGTPIAATSNPSGYKYSDNHNLTIEILSSSDEEGNDSMPELVDRHCHYDSVSRRTAPSSIPPSVPIPSYFESGEDDDDEEEYLDDSGGTYLPLVLRTSEVLCNKTDRCVRLF